MMLFLEIAAENNITHVVLVGTMGMLLLATGIIVFIIFHQRKMIQNQQTLRAIEENVQRTLLNASISSQEQERQRIAADLHDDAGPLLAAARLHLNENLFLLQPDDQRKSIVQVKEIIDESIDLIRNISHRLVPPTLKNFGLASAVSDLFQKLDSSNSIKATCKFNHYEKRMAPETEASIFRVIQELVNNILKHSNASFIRLEQNANEMQTIICITNDGLGLTMESFQKLSASANGLGLKNIQSRIRLLSGEIQFLQNANTKHYETIIVIPEVIT